MDPQARFRFVKCNIAWWPTYSTTDTVVLSGCIVVLTVVAETFVDAMKRKVCLAK